MRSLAAILVACTLGLTLVAESHAAPPKHGIGVGVLKQNYRGGHAVAAPDIVWPQSPCNLEHRMDVAIVEGMFFECQCMRLHVGYQCDWYLVAGVSAAPSRKRSIIAHAKRVIRIYALPAVTA